MAVVAINNLLEAGVHFGHQKRRWNPKMKKYIFTSRDDIYIIDLEKTLNALEEAYKVLESVTLREGTILFVGTKRQAQEAVAEVATKGENFYVNNRWLGGTLTNFRTIRSRVRKLEEIEKMEEDGTLSLLPKKEVIKIKKEYDKLLANLQGIRNMRRLPQLMVVVDPNEELIAVKEAKKLGIPVVGIVNTNSDPDLVDYVIPGKDDAIKSVSLLLNVLNNAVLAAKGKEIMEFSGDNTNIKTEEQEATVVTEEKPEVAEITVDKSDLESKTLPELKVIAREMKLTGYSTMKKTEIIELIKKN